MEILYLNTSGQIGGSERSLLTLIQVLRQEHPEWRFSLIVGEDGPLALSAAALGVSVQVLCLPRELALIGGGSRFRLGGAWRTLRALTLATAYRSRLKASIRAICPAVIHSNSLKMHFFLATISRGRSGSAAGRVFHLHDSLRGRPLERRLLKAAVRRYDTIVAVSEALVTELLGFSFAAKKIALIHNGVLLERFSPDGDGSDLDTLSQLPAAHEGVVRIGLVAAFARWKGHSTFMRALALLPAGVNIRAYAIGGPMYRTSGSQYTLEELRMARQCCCPQVEFGFTGVIPEVEKAYRALDIVVHASTEAEPFGMVVLEGMACGKPLIVSRGGGLSEVVVDEVNALIHERGDAAMLARQMERLVTDPGLRARLGESGRATVAARFQACTMAALFAQLYRTLAASTPAMRGAPREGATSCSA